MMSCDSDSADECLSDDDDIIEGDFVVVQVSERGRVVNYIARIDVTDNNEYEGIFLSLLLNCPF